MKNDIINLLSIPDEGIEIIKIEIIDRTKIIHLQKASFAHFCPECSARMHSKGIYKRSINHPIFQDGYSTKLIVHQRRWICSNEQCECVFNDSFSFLEKYKQSISITPYLIIETLKDINITAVQVAKRFNVSDTYVHYTFLKYINLQRLPLSRIIAIDEVYLNFNYQNRYALVIMDFVTGQIIDILPNRFKDTARQYFLSIPKEERDVVEYLVCDMYNPYINYTKDYFRHAKAVVDSFHVVQWINRKITSYITEVKKKYQERDKALLREENFRNNHDYETRKDSKEVYLLKNFKWFLLMAQQDVEYKEERKFNRTLGMYLDTYQLEQLFLKLDDKFKEIRDLKDIYITFNRTIFEDENQLEHEFSSIVSIYEKSEIQMFRDFAGLLNRYKPEIFASFLYIKVSSKKYKETLRRLSNGPLESFNNIPKDLKRVSNGVTDFEYTRNRILWATRENPPILAVPRSDKEVRVNIGKERGEYSKK